MPPVPKPKRRRHHTFIKAWREFRNLTQEQVAERMGTSRENYGRIENGKVPYNQDTLELIGESLNCSTADLLERDPHTENMVDRLRTILARATPAERKQLFRVAESLIENKG